MVNRNWNKTTKVAVLSEVQNLLPWKFFASCVMVASLFSMLFKCVSSWQEGVSLWLMICHHDTQKMFSHFTLVLESELSSALETCIKAAWLLIQLIIRTGVIVPNVQKCVMVATPTLYKLNCEQCNMTYIREIGRKFSTRLNEHETSQKLKNDKSLFGKYAMTNNKHNK